MSKKTASKKVEKDHAKTGTPVSPTEDPADHSVSASTLAAKVDPTGKSGATVNAQSIDAVNTSENDKAKLDEDQSVFGKARRMGMFFVRDHSRGGAAYIGVSPQNDPDADRASKERSLVEPLELHAPATGMEIRYPGGETITVPDGYGPGSQPGDWAKIVKPDGSPAFG